MVNTSTNVNTTIPPRSTKQSALSNMDLTLRGCTSNLAGKSLVFIYSQETTSTSQQENTSLMCWKVKTIVYKGRSPSNGKLSDFSFYIASQQSAHRKFKK
jgi:hypothetical protein